MYVNPQDYNGPVDWLRASFAHPDVVEAVKRYDPLLHIYYDKAINRWMLVRCTPRGYFLIAALNTPDGGFRPLDMSIIASLRKWDMRPPTTDAPRSANEIADRMDREDIEREDKKRRDHEEKYRLGRVERNHLERAIGRALNVN